MGNIYKEDINRKQQIFFPPSIDEYVSKDNQARAIEDYVELLDTAELGFTNASLNSADGTLGTLGSGEETKLSKKSCYNTLK